MTFNPGFRISILDVLFMLAMATLAIFLAGYSAYFALIATTPVVQFFLFCNVFRIRRIPELVWSGSYIIMAAMGYWNGYEPSSIIAFGLSIGGIIIFLETQPPSYHGVFWRRLNPELEAWFYREKNAQNAKIPQSNRQQ